MRHGNLSWQKGSGVSVESNVKAGPITTLGVTQTIDGHMKMKISKGKAIKNQLKIGNTQTHVKFSLHPDEYMYRWFIEAPTHHLAMSVGDNVSVFDKVAYICK